MRLTLERDKALTAVARPLAAAHRKATVPILSNLMLAADNGGLLLVGTDGDLEEASRVEAAVDQIGAITVPAQPFADLLRNFPPGAEVAIAQEGDALRVAVSCGRARFVLPALPASDFPLFAPAEDAIEGVIDAETLRRLIDRTQFSLGPETEVVDMKKSLYLHAERVGVDAASEAVLRCAATDGKRFAVAWAACPKGLEGLAGVMLSRKTLGELRAVCDAPGDAAVTLRISERSFEALRGGDRLTSKVVEGTYYPYSRVIPTGEAATLRVRAKAFAAALHRARILATAGSIKVSLDPEAQTATLAGRNSDGGAGEEAIEVAYDGRPFAEPFKASDLLDVLGVMANDAVLEIRKGHVVKVLDPADPASVFIVQTLRA